MEFITSTNPSDNFSLIDTVPVTTEDEILEKVQRARMSQFSWAKFDLSKRLNILRGLHAIFEENKDKLAELTALEMGMPIKEAQDDIDGGLAYFLWYLDNAPQYLKPEVTYDLDTEIHEVHRVPVGVVASIIAWNFPFSLFIWQAGQSLIAGNAVVFKHSEEVPVFSNFLEKLIDSSELPHGVFEMVIGGRAAGAFLIQQDIDMITFTGSSQVGKEIYKVAAEKFIPAVMELGGSAPGIVFEDADVGEVIESIYINRFLNCGQSCDGLKRLIVHESLFEETVEKLRQQILGKKQGQAIQYQTDLGPLVSQQQVDKLKSQVEDAVTKGARIECGGKKPENLKGAYFEPTILTNISQNMAVWKEEVFGPVIPVIPFSNYEQAMELANDTQYGLGGYVFTRSKQLAMQAAQDLKSGMVTHNNCSYVQPGNPFVGIKSSGMGSENGKYGFEEVTRLKVMVIEK